MTRTVKEAALADASFRLRTDDNAPACWRSPADTWPRAGNAGSSTRRQTASPSRPAATSAGRSCRTASPRVEQARSGGTCCLLHATATAMRSRCALWPSPAMALSVVSTDLLDLLPVSTGYYVYVDGTIGQSHVSIIDDLMLKHTYYG